MADYVEILDTQIEPDAPLTASLASQWRDNVLAIAEGAVGAPRVRPLGLDLMIDNNGKNFTGTPATFTGLTGISTFAAAVSITESGGGSASSVQVSGSTNNGSSWSSYFNILTTDPSTTSTRFFMLSLDEGRIDMQLFGDLVGTNAIRFRSNGGSGTGRVAILGLGRT